MVRRFLERRPIFSPDRGHIHHQLLAMGINHRRAVLILYGLSILFTTGAILMSMGRDWQVGGALLVLSVASSAWCARWATCRSLRRWRRQERLRAASVERLRARFPPRPRSSLAAERRHRGRACSSLRVRRSCSRSKWRTARRSAAIVHVDGAVDRHDTARLTAGAMRSALVRRSGRGKQRRAALRVDDRQGDVPPESDILLQLVADAVDARLQRADSGRTETGEGPPALGVARVAGSFDLRGLSDHGCGGSRHHPIPPSQKRQWFHRLAARHGSCKVRLRAGPRSVRTRPFGGERRCTRWQWVRFGRTSSRS